MEKLVKRRRRRSGGVGRMRTRGLGARRGLRWVRRDERGFGLVEIALALVVVAIVGSVLYAYLASTTRTLQTVQEERPLSRARLAADRATLTAIRSSLQAYYGQHGQWPPNKEAVAALMSPPPAFQCTGNDYTYDPGTGEVAMLVDDSARC